MQTKVWDAFWIVENHKPWRLLLWKINHIELKLITRLRLGLDDLNEHKYDHNFCDCVDRMCSSILETQSKILFFSSLPLL